MVEKKNEITGWQSRIEIALLSTKKRIVLHGNVMDMVFVNQNGSTRMLSLPEWLCRILQDKGYARIVRYDHEGYPEIFQWGETPPDQAKRALTALTGRDGSDSAPQTDMQNPDVVLNALRGMLASSVEPAAAIISHAALRIPYPSQTAVCLQRLPESAAEHVPVKKGITETLNNVVIHIYGSERDIPQEFIGAPDTAMIPVSRPNFEERKSFFDGSQREFHDDADSEVQLSGDIESSLSLFESDALARMTDGCRISELSQLAALSKQMKIGFQRFPLLLSLLRTGRKHDPWRHVSLGDATGHFKREIGDTLLGQPEAIDRVLKGIYEAKYRTGRIIDPTTRKPACVLFFVGGTGVGKTMMARVVTEYLTGAPDNLLRLDMSEYQQNHSIYRLIGAPPGYVGFSEGGQLTNWVKERPYSVILLEEMEKAHPRVYDLFLQILDGARLTDGRGDTVDLFDSIIIFTSNIGARDAGEAVFTGDRDQVSEYFTKAVEAYFREQNRLEIYNRLKKGLVVFNFITRNIAERLVIKKLEDIAERVTRRLRSQGSRVQLDAAPMDETVVENLLAGVDYRYGLRDVDNCMGETLAMAIPLILEDSPDDGHFGYRWNEHERRLEFVPIP